MSDIEQWAHREAGLHVMFEWQDGPWNGILDSTTVLGSVISSDGIETHIVYCEGTGFDHDTPFTLKEYIAVSKSTEQDEDGNAKIIVEDATEEQIKAVTEEPPDLTLEHRDRQNELDIDDPNYVFPEDR